MGKILLLDNKTINKIAAGEVVESPKSVVKELVENSIDAGANFITIEIRDGGTSFLRITDNGCGIKKDEVETAFLRHATNKITKIEDLETALSLGFRGEALASIAAVAQVRLTTKTKEDAYGTKIEIHGGEIIAVVDVATNDGTTIIVENIFYNVPARRKFLKKASTEGGHISDVVNRLALAHPEISFKYINNKTTILQTSGNKDLKTAVLHVYGKDTANKMIDISVSNKDFTLTGLLGKPEISRANRSYETLFINGRFIKNSVISSALEDAYKTRLLIGKFPIFVLNFTINPSLIDVNVHPAKLEVRFQDDDLIYKFFYESVSKSFQNKVFIPKATLIQEKKEAFFLPIPVEQKTIFDKKILNPVLSETQAKFNIGSNILDDLEIENFTKKISGEEVNDKKVIDKKEIGQNKKKETLELQEFTPFFKNYRIIGQVFNTYWILEQENSLFLIDQHAAHERILYEKLMNELLNERVPSQRLIEPFMLSLTQNEKEILNDNMDLFTQFGFMLEMFGEHTFALSAVPFIIKAPENARFFLDILDLLGETAMLSVYDNKLTAIATMACKAAVKANDKLSITEATTMVSSLLKLENPFTCPHGRPTIIELSKYEIEKKFKRIV